MAYGGVRVVDHYFFKESFQRRLKGSAGFQSRQIVVFVRSGWNFLDLLYWLGRMYEEGVDGIPNPQQACNCYQKALAIFEKEYESGAIYHRKPNREKFRYHQKIKNDIQRRLAPFL